MKNLVLIAIGCVIYFQNFSFAVGLSYQYMEDQEYNLPISHALYLKEDGTICVANFEDQKDQNNVLAQNKNLRDQNLVTKCNDEDTTSSKNLILEYLSNSSFKATKVSFPAIAMTGVITAGVGCLFGFIGADVVLGGVGYEPDQSDIYPTGSVVVGGAFGVLLGIPLLAMNN